MKLETLNERIANAQTRLEKKQNTIIKKYALIEKKKAQIQKMVPNPTIDAESLRIVNTDAFWLHCDIEHLMDDIERIKQEIEQIKANITKLEAQRAGEMERESIFTREIPETMKRMQTELVEEWDRYDIEKKKRIWEDKANMDYKSFCKKWSVYDRMDFIYKTEEQIHDTNMEDAKRLILNLYNRIKDITGEVTDWNGIQATIGTWGGTVLNGFVIGKQGRALVESIYAGGYNIQRLHVRVLVKEIG